MRGLTYWISDRNKINDFDLQVTQILPTKFQVDCYFGSGEEVQNRFSRWLAWWPS